VFFTVTFNLADSLAAANSGSQPFRPYHLILLCPHFKTPQRAENSSYLGLGMECCTLDRMGACVSDRVNGGEADAVGIICWLIKDAS